MKPSNHLPSPRKAKTKTALRFAACWLMVTGCAAERNELSRQELYSVYVDTVREYALMKESPDNPLHWETANHETWKSDYSVVFVDADYVSYRCEEYSYTGAHMDRRRFMSGRWTGKREGYSFWTTRFRKKCANR